MIGTVESLGCSLVNCRTPLTKLANSYRPFLLRKKRKPVALLCVRRLGAQLALNRVAMERGRSLPPRGNAFWSELVQPEWSLKMTRPVDLPAPDDVEEELEPEVPIQDQSSSHGSARDREPSRPRRNEKFNTAQEKRKPVALCCIRFF